MFFCKNGIQVSALKRLKEKIKNMGNIFLHSDLITNTIILHFVIETNLWSNYSKSKTMLQLNKNNISVCKYKCSDDYLFLPFCVFWYCACASLCKINSKTIKQTSK